LSLNTNKEDISSKLVDKKNGNKPKKIVTKRSKNLLALKPLLEEGITIKEAANILGIHEKYCYYLARILKENDITNPQVGGIMYRVIKKIGQDFLKERDTVKASDALAAAKEYWDRKQPKVKVSQNVNMNIGFTVVPDEVMARYQDNTTPDVVDGEFEEVNTPEIRHNSTTDEEQEPNDIK
jgi:hypothetical protein